jgi:tetratricopeptide (TPR) repeat protein
VQPLVKVEGWITAQQVSETKKGIALLTSAAASETSLEGAQWGGGHGVFTHFVLEGMRGAADNPRDGVVAVRELFEYVRKQVQLATDNQQHPNIGNNSFDPNLPMAITGGISAQEQYQLGCQLYELGRRLDDKICFHSAVRYLYEALRLARVTKVDFPEAQLQLGLTLLALGDSAQAIQAFAEARAQDKANNLPEVLFYLGVARAKQGDYEAATQVLTHFLEVHPQDERAAWVDEYVTWIEKPKSGRKYALLIGINEYSDPRIPDLAGCLEDIRLMKEVLIRKFGFRDEDFHILTDSAATRQNIINEFQDLAVNHAQYDTVLIHFSGRGETGDSDVYLVVHDTVLSTDQETSNAITAKELHDLMVCIPVRNKIIILDTHANNRFLHYARNQSNYIIFMAGSPNETPREHTFERDSENVWAGAFTYFLVQKIDAFPDIQQANYQQIVSQVTQEVSRRYRHTPLFIGDGNKHLFEADKYLQDFDFSQRRSYSSMTLDDLQQYFVLVQNQVAAPFPELHYSFGHAFLEKDSYSEALHALQIAIEQSNQNYPAASFALGVAQFHLRQYGAASATLQRYSAMFDSLVITNQIQQLTTLLKQLEHPRKYALLVGIDEYVDPSIPRIHGAVNDASALKQLLVSRYGFQDSDVTLLLNGDATRQAIVDAFQELVAKAREAPALFYFAGNGSSYGEIDSPRKSTPTIVSFDGRQPNIFDIEIPELAQLTGKTPTNLIAVFDAGWTHYNESNSSDGHRVVAPDERSRPNQRDLFAPRDLTNILLNIGHFSLYANSISTRYKSSNPPKIEAEFPALEGNVTQRIHGVLTYILLEVLQEADLDTLTCAQLTQRIADKRKGAQPFVVGDNLDRLLFTNLVLEQAARASITRITQEPIKFTTKLLELMIKQRNGIDPEGNLNLGIAYAAIADYDKSIAALEHAIDQQEGRPYPEAHYHLGRVLFESKRDLARAVSELRLAVQYNPDNLRVHYYLGQALRGLVEREILVEAESALRTYLEHGAPLGQVDDVQQFLDSRREQPTR